MNAFLWQSSLSLALFYFIYRVYFRKLTFFQLNRWLIFLISSSALILPFVQFSSIDEISTQVILPVIYADGSAASNVVPSWYDTLDYSFLTSIYFIGLIFSLTLLIIRFIRLSNFLNQKTFNYEDGFLITHFNERFSSFSFFNRICINETDKLDSEIIIEHEKIHFRLGHSYDNIAFELFKCIFWFNPIIFLFHKELRNIHEYEVDRILSLEKGERSYVENLTKEVLFQKEMSLTSSFKSNSNLLNRIKMIYKKPKPNWLKVSYLAFLPLVFLVMFAVSCSNTSKDVSPVENEEVQVEDSRIISGEELKELSVMPSFSGGAEEMYKYLGEQLKYPEEAKEEGLSGKVFVKFVVNREGKITNAEVMRGLHPLFDDEALRVIKNMPDWTPGELNGEKVSVEFVLPVMFSLN